MTGSQGHQNARQGAQRRQAHGFAFESMRVRQETQRDQQMRAEHSDCGMRPDASQLQIQQQ